MSGTKLMDIVQLIINDINHQINCTEIEAKHYRLLLKYLKNINKDKLINNGIESVLFSTIKMSNPSADTIKLAEEIANINISKTKVTDLYGKNKPLAKTIITLLKYILINNPLIEANEDENERLIAYLFTANNILSNDMQERMNKIVKFAQKAHKNTTPVTPSCIFTKAQEIDISKVHFDDDDDDYYSKLKEHFQNLPVQMLPLFVNIPIEEFMSGHVQDIEAFKVIFNDVIHHRSSDFEYLRQTYDVSFTEQKKMYNLSAEIIKEYQSGTAPTIEDILTKHDQFKIFEAIKLVSIVILAKVDQLCTLRDWSDIENVEKKYPFDQTFESLIDFMSASPSLDNERWKQLNEDFSHITQLKKELDRNNGNAPISYLTFNFKCLDKKQEILLYKMLIEYNLQFYLVALEQNKQYKNAPIHQLENLFNEFHLTTNQFTVEEIDKLVSRHSIDEIREMLILLKHPTYVALSNNPSVIINILTHSEPEILNNVIGLAKKNIVNSMICHHPEILYRVKNMDSDATIESGYERLIANLEVLTEHLKNLSRVSNNAEILLANNDILSNNIHTLDTYGINYNSDSTLNYEFLINKDLEFIINRFIEIGMSNYITVNPQILRTGSLDIIKRIVIAKSLGMDIIDVNDNLSRDILTGDKFIVPVEDLDNYIDNSTLSEMTPEYAAKLSMPTKVEISESVSNLQVIRQLDTLCLMDNQTYLIGDIPIPKNKVLKNMTILTSSFEEDIPDMLFCSLVNNSILSRTEVKSIKKFVSEITSKGKVIKL